MSFSGSGPSVRRMDDESALSRFTGSPRFAETRSALLMCMRLRLSGTCI